VKGVKDTPVEIVVSVAISMISPSNGDVGEVTPHEVGAEPDHM